ncbi:DUF1732 domain-containing protein [Pseudenhygromyxa sp. WMMC2535]|uniref:YicC family protein n=1 Tax=Pseudenhygromyxa sp. WMMC2535 TaxID=2712867 RepID=UPI001553ED83|nr:DUF1732 domain-containing protein [Pseudenhygromyxa sp. WMMC2535]NVB41508.1 DUF1732 domain-containing protein [Pseudenhygromyxa sp. WMMC2535]
MTGFGLAERGWSERGATVRVELRSVNARFLEIKIRQPFDAAVEHALRKRVEARLGRGRVDLSVRVEGSVGSEGDPLQALGVEPARVEEALAALSILADQAYRASFQVSHPTSLELLRFLTSRGASPASSAPERGAPDFLEALVDEALDKLAAMREQEGASLASVLGGFFDELEAQRDALEQALVGEDERLLAGLVERTEALLARVDAGTVERERLVAELAILVQRGDVSEELARITSHLEQARGVLAAQAEVGQGKTLDFIAQELLREVTTIGSKITSHQGSATVIAAKRTIERLREQVQNVE